MAPTPHTPTDGAASKPYASPAVTALGSIASVTAGNETGSLDCLVGTVPGGFGQQPSPSECPTS